VSVLRFDLEAPAPVTVGGLLEAARGLLEGSGPYQYRRGVVELVCVLLGLAPADYRRDVLELLEGPGAGLVKFGEVTL
jgi:hypothetical protein